MPCRILTIIFNVSVGKINLLKSAFRDELTRPRGKYEKIEPALYTIVNARSIDDRTVKFAAEKSRLKGTGKNLQYNDKHKLLFTYHSSL